MRIHWTAKRVQQPCLFRTLGHKYTCGIIIVIIVPTQRLLSPLYSVFVRIYEYGSNWLGRLFWRDEKREFPQILVMWLKKRHFLGLRPVPTWQNKWPPMAPRFRGKNISKIGQLLEEISSKIPQMFSHVTFKMNEISYTWQVFFSNRVRRVRKC